MSIVKMKKLALMAVSSQREELLRELMLLGCVEITEPEAKDADGLMAKLGRVESGDAVARNTERGRVMNAIRILDRYAPVKSGLLNPQPAASTEKILDEKAVGAALDTAERIISLEEGIRAAGAEESRERAALESMAPWRELTLPLDAKGTEHTAVIIGAFPAVSDLDAAELALSEAAPEAQLFRVSEDKAQSYVVLVALREELDEALASIRPLGFAAASFGDVRGTAAENMERSEKKLAELAAEKERLSAGIAAMADARDELKLRADTLATMSDREDAAGRLMCTESVSLLTGWVPEEKLPELTALLEKYDCAYETEDPAEDEIPEVPVELKNNRFTRALNMVTNMYSLPAYDGVDPNPLMAPFFILFYGLMLADLGYGILMVIAAIVVLRRKKPIKGTRYFCELLLYCGISTTVFGAITGGCFGDAPYQIVHIINPASTWPGLPALFTPLNDTVMVLLGAMALGFVHIVTGMAISLVEKFKRGEYLDAVAEEITWWVVFAGIGFMALGITNIVIYIGIAMVVAFPLIQGKGFGKVTGIFGSLYNHVTGFFGDILSYSRIMALMLAGSVIAQVFNTIGAIAGNLIVFLVISLVGNALNFALNLLGCYVHDLRLQCLEFFGKFYKDGGRPFKPLAINTKFYQVDTVNN